MDFLSSFWTLSLLFLDSIPFLVILSSSLCTFYHHLYKLSVFFLDYLSPSFWTFCSLLSWYYVYFFLEFLSPSSWTFCHLLSRLYFSFFLKFMDFLSSSFWTFFLLLAELFDTFFLDFLSSPFWTFCPLVYWHPVFFLNSISFLSILLSFSFCTFYHHLFGHSIFLFLDFLSPLFLDFCPLLPELTSHLSFLYSF